MNRQFQQFQPLNSSQGRPSYMDRPQATLNQPSDLQSSFSQFSGLQNPSPSLNSNGNKELAVLFYSNNCSVSKAFLSQLYKSTLNEKIRKVCVDRSDVKIPRIITAVPTIVARGINRPIVGEQTMAWLENENKKISGSVQKKEADLESYNFGAKDNYSFIDEGNNDLLNDNVSFAQWDKDYVIPVMTDTDSNKKQSSGPSFSMNNQSQKGFGSEDISKMRMERDSMIGRPNPKMVQMDNEQFNMMFNKQKNSLYKNI